jgi:hypothetical protein
MMSGCTNKKKSKQSIDENVVILHQMDRGVFAPSISPFPLKLETYLRMAGIPYQVKHPLVLYF